MKRYIDIEDMVNVNCSNVLDIIQKNVTVSRKQITELSGLSWGGMTKIVNKLLEKGYIIEQKSDSSAIGRTPGKLSVNKSKNFVIGLDINKTGLNGVVTDLTGEVLKKYSFVTLAEEKTGFLKEITDFLEKIFADFKNGEIISIGVALQGIMDYKKGISVKFPGISDWENVPVKSLLEEKFNVSVFVEHDPDCLLYSHLDYENKENVILFRIDKGIGMAASVNGRIIKGEGVLEIAHNIVIPNGKQCRCGQKGCLQAYVSPCMESEKIDKNAVNELMLPLVLTIKNMINIFNAGKVILTGELINYKDEFKDNFETYMKENNVNADIEFSALSDRAVKGAALRAVDKSINSLFI